MGPSFFCHFPLRMTRLIAIFLTLLTASSHAVDYQSLSAVKRLTADKRYDEAIQKLEALAAKTEEVGENFHYLDLAMDITVKSLKNADRSLALAAQVKDAAHRDFARLRVLTDFQRYDEALASVREEAIETWPVRCRGQAHGFLAEIYHKKKDEAAELRQWQKAAEAPGAEVSVRGRAHREAAVLHLKHGDTAKAEEHFRKALAVTPANYAWRVESLAGLSRLLIDNKRPREAVKAFEGTDFSKIDHITSKGTLLEAYARALLAAGKKIKAIETFDQLLQLNLPAAWKDRINQELDEMAEEF
jgi:tetratricopeptide (TPR) repeat protein